MDEITTLPTLPLRRPESHKGDFGRVLIVGGSKGMSGAAVLCGRAALRGGAGLVRVAVPEAVQSVVAAGNPCYMTLGLPADDEGRLSAAATGEILSAAKESDVLAIGPGLGRSTGLDGLVVNVLKQVAIPSVLDADGINSFINHPARLDEHFGPVIITPHPGELARLLKITPAQVQANRRELASKFAQEHRVLVVLKGARTIVTDGRRIYENSTGNPGMATGGTGDVLTGLIAALLGQGLELFEAAQLGVYVHGWAGDMARDEFGELSLTALDLLDFLFKAFRRL